MVAILGIDAAWTATKPSGIALVSNASGVWRCVAVAPSYAAFAMLAEGRAVDWSAPSFAGDLPDPPALLHAAGRLLGGEEDVSVVTVDMPIATCDVVGRRVADREISKKFGAAWCSAHSPNRTRPGAIGKLLTARFADLGFALATTSTSAGTTPALVEVYPHPALLALTGASKRLEYKIAKAGRTIVGVREVWLRIVAALQKRIGGIDLTFPETLTKMAAKRYEDAIDALVCACVGIEYLEGTAVRVGDETAAIWCPAPVAEGRAL